ncbi:MAG: flagellar export chaperone FliS [Alphaproteobacteria bacterium]
MAYPTPQNYLAQQVNTASPAQQVVMMYDGAIKFCLKAKEAIEAGDIQARHNANKRAMEIVSYMLDILDLEKGGDVARRLQVVYSFMLRRLLEVDFRNDPRICDEVVGHLRTLRASWEKIGKLPSGNGNATTGEFEGAPTSAVA